MNNNRGNNRRRGRGGNRQQGGQQVNRIDSRARGNAPQLLEKYRKLAHDAHLNGDRVQEEYYLQFADHYFRVLADQRQRQEESRQPRRDDRSQDYGDEAVSYEEADADSARPYQDRAYQDRAYQDRGPQDREPRADREPRGDREVRGDRRPRTDLEERSEPAEAQDETGPESERSIYEPVENPFVRDNRGARGGLKQRRPRRDREEANGNVADPADTAAIQEDEEAASGGFDPAVLPPAISAQADEKPKRRARTKVKAADGEVAEDGEEKPKRRRARKASSSPDGGDGAGGSALETVE